MTRELIAALLVWFVVANAVTYHLYVTSNRRVSFRQKALPAPVIALFTLLGGAPAAWAAAGHYHLNVAVMDRRVLAFLAIAHIGIIILVIADTLAELH